jgi:hypothetical protein
LKQYQLEFDRVVQALTNADINVVLASVGLEKTPDSIFPNNWLSIHDNGEAAIYPMKVENRRLEIRPDIIEQLKNGDFISGEIYDLTHYVPDGKFFEGTGALVLDREHRIAYVNLSQRSDAQLAVEWSNHFGYKLVLFEAFGAGGHPIYHTNVLMSIGSTFAIVCLDSIRGEATKRHIADVLRKDSGKDVIEISMDQMKNYCGNVLELQSRQGQGILAMSDKAFQAFTEEQIARFEGKHNLQIIHPDIDNIEVIFGGGVRCMIAEVFTAQ